MKKTIITTGIIFFITSIANANPLTDYIFSDYKKEISNLKEKHKGDVLKLLKGRSDIIISVKHYTYQWDYVLCADFIRETESSDLSCDFELDSSSNKDLMEYKASQLKIKLTGR